MATLLRERDVDALDSNAPDADTSPAIVGIGRRRADTLDSLPSTRPAGELDSVDDEIDHAVDVELITESRDVDDEHDAHEPDDDETKEEASVFTSASRSPMHRRRPALMSAHRQRALAAGTASLDADDDDGVGALSGSRRLNKSKCVPHADRVVTRSLCRMTETGTSTSSGDEDTDCKLCCAARGVIVVNAAPTETAAATSADVAADARAQEHAKARSGALFASHFRVAGGADTCAAGRHHGAQGEPGQRYARRDVGCVCGCARVCTHIALSRACCGDDCAVSAGDKRAPPTVFARLIKGIGSGSASGVYACVMLCVWIEIVCAQVAVRLCWRDRWKAQCCLTISMWLW
jgi:hypothetical protein